MSVLLQQGICSSLTTKLFKGEIRTTLPDSFKIYKEKYFQWMIFKVTSLVHEFKYVNFAKIMILCQSNELFWILFGGNEFIKDNEWINGSTIIN